VLLNPSEGATNYWISILNWRSM